MRPGVTGDGAAPVPVTLDLRHLAGVAKGVAGRPGEQASQARLWAQAGQPGGGAWKRGLGLRSPMKV